MRQNYHNLQQVYRLWIYTQNNLHEYAELKTKLVEVLNIIKVYNHNIDGYSRVCVYTASCVHASHLKHTYFTPRKLKFLHAGNTRKSSRVVKSTIQTTATVTPWKIASREMYCRISCRTKRMRRENKTKWESSRRWQHQICGISFVAPVLLMKYLS